MNWQSLTDRIQQLDSDCSPVTRSIFGTTEPQEISTFTNRFVRTYLRDSIVGCSFIYISVGATCVVRLGCGQIVVIKAYGLKHGLWALRPPALRSSFRVQANLAQAGFACPAVIVAPQVQGRTLFIAQSYCNSGKPVDPFAPNVRREMAVKLADLIQRTRRLTIPNDLAPWMPWLSDEISLWPTPHNALFDFEKTNAGAEWIDTIAVRAQAVLLDLTLEPTIGHADWSLQNMAFQNGQLTCVFDWDSLRVGPEPFFVGGAARCYAHDWRTGGPERTITVAEAEAFIQEYEVARGRPFSTNEQVAIGAAMVYTLAYGARCAHAIAPNTPWAYQIKAQLRKFCDLFLPVQINQCRSFV